MCNQISMIKVILLLILTSFSIASFSQQDSIKIDKHKTNRYIVWLIPSVATNIYGIAIGPCGSEAICKRPYTKFSHGINFQIIGQGFLQTFYINKGFLKNNYSIENQHKIIAFHDTTIKRALHNGILLSPFGTFTDQINGISFSCWMSMGRKVNGISFNSFWNVYDQINGISIACVNNTIVLKGVQIGLFNSANKSRGFQFGLWNKNAKRSLPIMNWNFKD